VGYFLQLNIQYDPAVPNVSHHYQTFRYCFPHQLQRQPLIVNLSRLIRIATLLTRYLRLVTAIADSHPRLTTVGWLDLNQAGFPPVRLIALRWAHN